MSAFNARLQAKEIFGIPIFAVLSAVVLLPTIALAALIQYTLLKVFLGLVAFVIFLATIAFLVLGDEVMFLSVRLKSRLESSFLTGESWCKK